jgi:hypothetical protein
MSGLKLDARRWAKWLLDYVALDLLQLRKSKKTLSRELFDFVRPSAASYLQGAPDSTKQLAHVNLTFMRQTQKDLRNFLATVSNAGGIFHHDISGGRTMFAFQNGEPGFFQFGPDLRSTFLVQAMEVFGSALRLCLNPSCGKPFVPSKRGGNRYCSKSCSQEARTNRYVESVGGRENYLKKRRERYAKKWANRGAKVKPRKKGDK